MKSLTYTEIGYGTTLSKEYSSQNPSSYVYLICKSCFKNLKYDFSGGTVVKNPPANAGDTGSIPSPGRSHMPRSN